MTILAHGECFNLADIYDDKQHFVCGTDKFRIYVIFHQNNDGYDVVNDYESVMTSEKKIAIPSFAYQQIRFSGA